MRLNIVVVAFSTLCCTAVLVCIILRRSAESYASAVGRNTICKHCEKQVTAAAAAHPMYIQEVWHHDSALYEYVINEVNRCDRQHQDIVIVVITAAEHNERRVAIRRTWLQWTTASNLKISYVFLVGISHSTIVNALVAEESVRYHDVVQGSFFDSYNNLTVKSVSMLNWVLLHCPSASYLLKADDDVFVNLPFVATLLGSDGGRRLRATIVGRILQGSRPVTDRTAKWFAGEGFTASTYPAYASGPLYIITTDVIRELLTQALLLPYLRIEDVFVTGLCAAACPTSIVRLHHPAITDLRLPPRGCHFRNTANGHNYTSSEMIEIWNDLSDTTVAC